MGLVILAMLLWQIDNLIARLTTDIEVMRFWDQILAIGWVCIGAFLIHFSLRFVRQKKSESILIMLCIYTPFVIFYTTYVSIRTPIDFTYHSFWGWVHSPRPGSLDIIQRYATSIAALIVLVLLIQHLYSQRHNRQRKYQVLLITIGILIPAIQGTITQVLLPAFTDSEIPITSTFLSFFSLATIVALRKFQLFNISDSLDVKGVLANLHNMVLIIAPDERIIYLNACAEQQLGMTLQKGENLSATHIFAHDHKELERFRTEVLAPALSGRQCSDYEISLSGAANERYDVLLTSQTIINNGLTQGVLLLTSDITERKRYIKAIEEQNARMREITWTQSHVVRAPLARIMGLVEIFPYDPTTKEQDEILAMLRQSANELDKVIHDIVQKSTEIEDKEADE